MKIEIIDNFTTLSTAAFGLVAALAWNAAIQELFKRYVGIYSTLVAMFLYAISVTIIGVLVTLWIAKFAQRIKEGKKKRT